MVHGAWGFLSKAVLWSREHKLDNSWKPQYKIISFRNSFHVDKATSLHMLVLLLHKGLDIWYIWNYALLKHKKSKIMTTIIKVIVEYNMIKFGTFIFVSYSFLIVVSSSGEGLVPSVNICKTCTPKQK